MAEACQDEADREYTSIKNYERMHPHLPPDEKAYRHYRALEGAANLARILANYEGDSRRFVAGLLKRHADGR